MRVKIDFYMFLLKITKIIISYFKLGLLSKQGWSGKNRMMGSSNFKVFLFFYLMVLKMDLEYSKK